MFGAADPTGHEPGRHARASVLRLRLRTLVSLGVLAVATALLGRSFGLRDSRFLGSEITLLASIFVISRYVLPLVERRDRGATAEEQVGRLLAELPEEDWHVIHDASFGRGNIDHIVIGPAGVFTIETKSHPGPVLVSQVHGQTIRQVQAQRKTIERVIDMQVEPLLVFSRAWIDRPLARRRGVRVLPARMLVGYLAKRRSTLAPSEIEATVERLAAALHEHGERSPVALERLRVAR